MKKALVAILKYVIFLGLGIWITYHMIHQLDDKQSAELISAITGLNPWYLIPISIVGVASHWVRALRWRYLLETIDLHPTQLNTMFAVMIGYLTNLAFPRAGEVAKCTVLAKYEDMPAHKMVGTIVAERAFDLFCLCVLALATFLIEFKRINDFVSQKAGDVLEKLTNNRVILGAGIAAMVLLALLGVYFYRRNQNSKLAQLLKELTHGVLSIFYMKKKWQFLGYTIIMWFLYDLQIHLGLMCLSEGGAHIPFMASMVVLVYGSVGLIVTPGGIGAYPFLVAQILGAYPISESSAQAFGWIAWAVQTVIIILGGLASLVFIHSYNKRRNAQAGVDSKQNTQPQ